MADANPDRDQLMVESSADEVVRKVQRLRGLELAMLLGVMAQEHCLVQAPAEALDACADAIEMIAAQTFEWSVARIECSASMSVEAFANGVLLNADQSDRLPKSPLMRRASYKVEHFPSEDSRTIPNVVVALNLEQAPHIVQMQALELIRTRRVLSRSDIYSAPKPFLFLPLTSISSIPLANHLNDFIFMSYSHQSDAALDGETSADQSDDFQEVRQHASDSKGIARSGVRITAAVSLATFHLHQTDISKDIQSLMQQRDATTLTVEMKRYLHNVLIFLRMHRGIAGGVTAKASRDFDCLARCLAPLNDLSFVTPSLVALAAKKVYPHRLKLASVDQERSMQYGSDAAAVAKILQGLTSEIIIDQVLQEVEVPL